MLSFFPFAQLTYLFLFRVAFFAFDLYDTDNDGVLTEIEIKVMFHDLYWYGSEAVEDKAAKK